MFRIMGTIKDIYAYELLDSRGNPTIGCKVMSNSGFEGFAIVPSGASTGEHEAFELRDNDRNHYHGKGVKKAIANINGPLTKALIGKSIFDQRAIDQIMIDLDGTENKRRLGANAILAISMAVCRCAAAAKDEQLYRYLGNDGYTLPTPMMNIINGGAHADNNVDFQEFMISPHGFSTFSDKVRAGSEVFHTLKKILKNKGASTAVGDEGGFAPNLSSTEEALDLIVQAIKETGYKPGKEISITLDCAASYFFKDGSYYIEKKDPAKGMRSASEQVSYLKTLLALYPITSIEDGLDENDWQGWEILTKECQDSQIVGDDIFVTNKKFLKRGIEEKVANAILIKPNQIGTITETLDTIAYAKDNNYSFIISHRSGETEDSFIADLAVATNAPEIKTGSLSRSERICKYNRLLIIEHEL
ncbi:MAG: Enolase 2 [Chlamydiia bacterium]|nr:Enolase 2 [Chlamydiia bacterium]MCH9618464.1 Enolase 2 [Chlamydiia bacterium]MCH9623926.1 Enolase 2 [Chlamydiia bacterium]